MHLLHGSHLLHPHTLMLSCTTLTVTLPKGRYHVNTRSPTTHNRLVTHREPDGSVVAGALSIDRLRAIGDEVGNDHDRLEATVAMEAGTEREVGICVMV